MFFNSSVSKKRLAIVYLLWVFVITATSLFLLYKNVWVYLGFTLIIMNYFLLGYIVTLNKYYALRENVKKEGDGK